MDHGARKARQDLSRDQFQGVPEKALILSLAAFAFVLLPLSRFPPMERFLGRIALLRLHGMAGLTAIALVALSSRQPLILVVSALALAGACIVWLERHPRASRGEAESRGLIVKRALVSRETAVGMHAILSIPLVAAAIVFSVSDGITIAEAAVLTVFSAAFILFIHGRLLQPALAGDRPWKVVETFKESGLITTIRFKRPEGFEFKPGDYCLFRFPVPGIDQSFHPVALSSSPSERGFVSVTVKASGDWSNLATEMVPEDLVIAVGPFPMARLPDFRGDLNLVFVLSGRGTGAILSILNYLADTDDSRAALAVRIARDRCDLVAAADFASFPKTLPRLKVESVLSHDPLWNGPRGPFDAAMALGLFKKRFGSDADPGKAVWIISVEPRDETAVVRAIREAGGRGVTRLSLR